MPFGIFIDIAQWNGHRIEYGYIYFCLFSTNFERTNWTHACKRVENNHLVCMCTFSGRFSLNAIFLFPTFCIFSSGVRVLISFFVYTITHLKNAKLPEPKWCLSATRFNYVVGILFGLRKQNRDGVCVCNSHFFFIFVSVLFCFSISVNIEYATIHEFSLRICIHLRMLGSFAAKAFTIY